MIVYIRLVITLLFAGILCLAQQSRSQVALTGAGLGAPGGGGFTPSCSQSSTFLARITTDATHQSAYDTFICGGVTDGWWAKSDAVYLVATDNTTNSLLNLVGTSFSLVSHGTNTFAANAGYTSNGTTGYFDTQYTPSTAGGHLTLNSATYGICIQNLGSNAGNMHGVFDGSNFLEELNYNNGTTTFTQYIHSLADNAHLVSTAVGTWTAVKPDSSTVNLYNAGSQVATTNLAASSSLPALPVFVSARNNAGTADTFMNMQWSGFIIGSAFSATDASNHHIRLAAYMTAVGGSGC